MAIWEVGRRRSCREPVPAYRLSLPPPAQGLLLFLSGLHGGTGSLGLSGGLAGGCGLAGGFAGLGFELLGFELLPLFRDCALLGEAAVATPGTTSAIAANVAISLVIFPRFHPSSCGCCRLGTGIMPVMREAWVHPGAGQHHAGNKKG